MNSSMLVISLFVVLYQVTLIQGFFGGGFPSFPGIPQINPRGQIGECHLAENVCNSDIIRIQDVAPYDQPLFSAIITPLIIADPSLNTKNCDAMCRCLTGNGGSCARQLPILNDNGCEFLRSKCRCKAAYGIIQQGQAAARLISGQVCV